jgi:hypothetical protein
MPPARRLRVFIEMKSSAGYYAHFMCIHTYHNTQRDIAPLLGPWRQEGPEEVS